MPAIQGLKSPIGAWATPVFDIYSLFVRNIISSVRMGRLREIIRRIPRYGWIAAPAIFFFNYALYVAGPLLARLLGTESWAFAPKIPFIDDKFQLIPAFVIIYVVSYAVWVFGILAVSLTDRRNFLNYVIGLETSVLIGFMLFILMPTIMDRVSEGVLQKVQEPGVLNWMMKFIYAADGWEKGRALFPSFHCLMSIYCYLGIRKQNEISRGFKVYTVVMTILICLSTLYTKQHYIVDVIGGLGIPVICYAIVRKLDPAGSIMKEKL